MKFNYLFLFFINLELIVFKNVNQNYWLIFILIPYLISFFVLKSNWKQWILILITSGIVFLWCWFFNPNLTIKNMNYWLNNQTHFYYVKNFLINYVNQSISDTNIASFTNYLLFNYINDDFKTFVQTINKMGISHLFVISGLHINLVLSIWDKLTKKWCPFWLTYVIRIIICLWFCYCLSFSNSTIRVLIQSTLKCNQKINNKSNLGLSGIIHGFLFNNSLLNYGYIFSYGCTFISILIYQSNIKYTIAKSYLVNLSCYFFTLPLIIKIGHQINFLSILFNIILSPCIIVVFGLTIVLMLIPYAYFIMYLPLNGFIYLINLLSQLNVTINIQYLPKYVISCYYFLISILFIFIFLLKKKSKRIFFTYNEYIKISKKERNR